MEGGSSVKPGLIINATQLGRFQVSPQELTKPYEAGNL